VLRLIWGADALDDLEEIARFIAKRNPSAADRIQGLIEAAAEKLPLHPYMYRTGRIPGTREAACPPAISLINLHQNRTRPVSTWTNPSAG
jgi:plasmid stabilization system protein ParE